jgi:predicted RNA-binding Zn-ribbon protein involved in translation (DUF1610 family)
MYAEPGRAGSKLACPDCHSENIVPSPPQKQPRQATDPLALADELKLRDESATEDHEEFQVRCPKCDGVDYATSRQIGKSILCPDCGSIIVVRAPPPKIVRKLERIDPKIEIEAAAELKETNNQTAARMEKARQEVERKEREKPIPPKRPFLDGTFAFPFYLEILPRWLVIAVLGCVAWSVVQVGRNTGTSPFEVAIAMVCGVLLVFIGLLTGIMLAGMCYTIVEFTGMGFTKAPHWPGFEIVDRLKSLLLFTAAFGFSVLPVALISMLLPEEIPFFAVVAPPIAFVEFPLVFLSMLDNDSMAVPISRLVFGSWRKQGKIWRAFYLACLPLAALVGAGAWLAAYIDQDAFTYGYIFLVTGCLVVYVRLLGRLGWALDQAIDIKNVGVDGDEERAQVHEHAS